MRKIFVASGTAAAVLLGTAGSAAGAADHAVQQTWHLHQTAIRNGATYDAGTVKGAPFGKGKVHSQSKPVGSKVRVLFAEKLAGGTVKGVVTIDYSFAGDGADYSGSGHFTRGTGAYKGISGKIKSWTGHGSTSGKATIHMKGTANY
jgi:hypothetical protein